MIVAIQFPVSGFLGTDATFAADVNFIVQLAMGGALIAGVVLAKQKRYRARGACQTAVLLLNVWMIALTMWHSFREQVVPRIPRTLERSYYAIATVHMLLGTSAELLGIYIVLVGDFRLCGFTRGPATMRLPNEQAVWNQHPTKPLSPTGVDFICGAVICIAKTLPNTRNKGVPSKDMTLKRRTEMAMLLFAVLFACRPTGSKCQMNPISSLTGPMSPSLAAL